MKWKREREKERKQKKRKGGKKSKYINSFLIESGREFHQLLPHKQLFTHFIKLN